MKPGDFEHERKFLVSDLTIIDATEEGTSIVQGHFGCAPGCSVRVRYYPTLDTYQFTPKLPRQGISREEHEQQLERGVGEAALFCCGENVVEKTRYPASGPDGAGWDIDVFHGRNEGLVMAEIELTRATDSFELPTWCGLEVTDDPRYYNDQLAFRPYSAWRDDR